ncbi:Hypothetical protein FKW44_007899, partial [Caligus rogercresseyi]
MTKMAADRDASIYTISKAVRVDLGYKSFTLRPSLRFFSDEKLFNWTALKTAEHHVDLQDPEDVPIVFKNPASVMSLG